MVKLHYSKLRKKVNIKNKKSNLEKILLQEKAAKALEFGTNINSHGYNIFCSGEDGSGKNELIENIATSAAEKKAIPSDQLMAYNFANPSKPIVLQLNPGKGEIFIEDLENLVNNIKCSLADLDSNQDYQALLNFLDQNYESQKIETKEKYEIKASLLGYSFQERVEKDNICIDLIPNDMDRIKTAINQIKEDTIKQLSDIGLNYDNGKLKKIHDGAPDENLKKGEKILDEQDKNLQVFVSAHMLEQKNMVAVKKVAGEYLQNLNKLTKQYITSKQNVKVTFETKVIKDNTELFKERYSEVSKWFNLFEKDIIENANSLNEKPNALAMLGMGSPNQSAKYKANLLIKNSKVPIIYEKNPTIDNLLGRLDKSAKGDDETSAHMKAKAGSLAKANDGYLIVDALKIFNKPGLWEKLAEALDNQEYVLDNGNGIFASTQESMPIKAKTKVIMTGPKWAKHALAKISGFNSLFKVNTELADSSALDDKTIDHYVSFIDQITTSENLPKVTKNGKERIIEYGLRLSNSQKNITTNFGLIANLIRESSYYAKEDNKDTVRCTHVQKALDERKGRVASVEERIQSMMNQGKLIVDVSGEKVGEINGLAVYSTGSHKFGKPSKITAVTSMGKQGIINIESKMSGKLYDKSLAIIYQGILKGRFGQDNAITLDASIAFEQCYGGIDGDSASIATLVALYSSISGIAINQELAVTGSLNQHGIVQPIGGVNEKVEGFYDTCKALGFTGNQGVIIPASNVQDLMLKQEIVDAVKKNKFHIYSVKNIDEAAEILMGQKAGNIQTKNTINHAVYKGLLKYSINKGDKK